MENKPDQSTDSSVEAGSDLVDMDETAPTVEDAAPKVEDDAKLDVELGDIKSFEDARDRLVDTFTDGIDKFKEASAADIKKGVINTVNRWRRGWQRLLDGTMEDKD